MSRRRRPWPEIHFLIARARWERDPRRARALAEEARPGVVDLGAGHEKSIAEIDAWLANPR